MNARVTFLVVSVFATLLSCQRIHSDSEGSTVVYDYTSGGQAVSVGLRGVACESAPDSLFWSLGGTVRGSAAVVPVKMWMTGWPIHWWAHVELSSKTEVSRLEEDLKVILLYDKSQIPAKLHHSGWFQPKSYDEPPVVIPDPSVRRAITVTVDTITVDGSAASYAGSTMVRGRVVDTHAGNLLSAAAVHLRNARTGVMADSRGWFTFDRVPSGADTLIILHVLVPAVELPVLLSAPRCSILVEYGSLPNDFLAPAKSED